MRACSIVGLVAWLLTGGCGGPADEESSRAVERSEAAASGLSADEEVALRARVRQAQESVTDAHATENALAEENAPAQESAPAPSLLVPAEATTSPSQPPSAAQDDGRIYLFNGKDLSGWYASGPYSDWHVEDGVLKTGGSAAYVLDEQGRRFPARATSDLISQRKFWNFQLHVEFKCPQLTVLPNNATEYAQVHAIEGLSNKQWSEFYKNWKGDPPGAEPSLWRRMTTPGGVYLRGRYRVHLAAKGWEYLQPIGSLVLRDNPYGRCGAIYGKVPVNASAAGLPDEWQALDVTLVGRTVTVVLNGATVIDQQEIPGPTGGALDIHESEPGPIVLQGLLAGPTVYRNVWVRELPGEPGHLSEPSAASLPKIEIPERYRSWVPQGGKPSPYLPLAEGNQWVYRITTRPVATTSQWKRIDWSAWHRPQFKGDDSYRAIDTLAREPFHSHLFFGLGSLIGLENPTRRSFYGGGGHGTAINQWRDVQRLTYTALCPAADQAGWWIMDVQTQERVVPEDFRWHRQGVEQIRWGPPVKMYDLGNLARVRGFEPLDVLCEHRVGTAGYSLVGFAPTAPFDWVPPISPSQRIVGKWAGESVVVPAGRFQRCWESAYYRMYEGRIWFEKAFLAEGIGLVKREQVVQYGKKEPVVTTLWELESYEIKKE